MSYRIGIGYDVHKLIKGRKLILGGVEIPYSLGLEGHSDADVLLHAISDAILGAASLGDIGEHFPNTDSQYKDISSLILLEKVNQLVKNKGYRVVNVDAVILAEAPKLSVYKMEMKARISKALNSNSDDIGIKATTNEGLGFIGKGEGIACYATVLLNRI